jgi:CRISPR-associated protein Csx14
LDISQILTYNKEIADLYRTIITKRSSIPATSETGILALDQENFASYKAKLNKFLMHGFGTVALRDIQISSLGQRPETRYGLILDRSQIMITN